MWSRGFLSTLKRGISVKCEPRITFIGEVNARRFKSSLPPGQAHIESDITEENLQFTYELGKVQHLLKPSPLKREPWHIEKWTEKSKRSGVIAIKLGMVPMWTVNGERITTTMLQVQDCNVVDYLPPDETKEKYSHLFVGAKNASPLYVEKEYADYFRNACVPVKQRLLKFRITEDARLQPGTPLYAAHFRPGMYVDITSKSIGHGFQGVMKRWGMKGQPASHGATKTHRKIGAVGSSAIWRVNTRYNILYVQGSVPGHHTSFVVVKDSTISKPENPPFPTYLPSIEEELPEDMFSEDAFQFDCDSISCEEDVEL
ncbi:large ribosomal subunit protein uL3m-like isoform X2 [Ptychodera flava]|uniref:large ribosomal subunit protein uL3m-like isoform X2 n=1 Tax=Ptychodera flava TaxID=63121 RepID=UPI00396A0822